MDEAIEVKRGDRFVWSKKEEISWAVIISDTRAICDSRAICFTKAAGNPHIAVSRIMIPSDLPRGANKLKNDSVPPDIDLAIRGILLAVQ